MCVHKLLILTFIPCTDGMCIDIQEIYGSHYELPSLGPLGANGLANARDFEHPVASFDIDQSPWEIVYKYVFHKQKEGWSYFLITYYPKGFVVSSMSANRNIHHSMSSHGTESTPRSSMLRVCLFS